MHEAYTMLPELFALQASIAPAIVAALIAAGTAAAQGIGKAVKKGKDNKAAARSAEAVAASDARNDREQGVAQQAPGQPPMYGHGAGGAPGYIQSRFNSMADVPPTPRKMKV